MFPVNYKPRKTVLFSVLPMCRLLKERAMKHKLHKEKSGAKGDEGQLEIRCSSPLSYGRLSLACSRKRPRGDGLLRG